MIHPSKSGWTGSTNGTCGGTTTATIDSNLTVTELPDLLSCYIPSVPEQEKPKYVPTKLDKQIQKKSFRAIQKQHERRMK